MIFRHIILYSMFFSWLTLLSCSHSRKEIGISVITKIEAYRLKHDKLPLDLNDIGLNYDESGPVYYTVLNDSVYEVYYGLDLGTSMVYNSTSKVWRKE